MSGNRWDALWERQAPTTTPVAGAAHVDPERMSRYAAAALAGEVDNVLTAAEGTRNDTLNRAGFALAQLVAAGHLEANVVHDTLSNAGLAVGLTSSEVEATLRSSIGAGRDHPRVVEISSSTSSAPAQSVDPFGEGYVVPDQSHPGTTERPGGERSELAEAGSGEAPFASWAPVDLEAILDGTYVPEEPSLMPRSDGFCLLYPGRVHSFHGESESGKSLVAQAEAARLLAEGGDVLFVDFESDAAAVVARMRELGATAEQIRAHFTYLRPESDPRKFAHEREAITAVLSRPYALAVIDGVTDALGIFGASSKDNDEVSAFMRLLPRAVARLTGAAVVLVDHVSKDADSRGRFAIGGQAKMASLDGAAYVVEVVEALGQGLRGEVVLRVAKDRPGGVRAHAGTFRKTDRTQPAARVVVDSTVDPHVIQVSVEAPRIFTESDDEFRPTGVMERISRQLELAVEPLSTTTIESLKCGKATTVREALALLVRDGFVRVEKAGRNARLHSSIRPFREDDEDAFGTSTPSPSHPVPTPSRRSEDDPVPVPSSSTRTGRGQSVDRTGRPRPSDPDTLVACSQCHKPTSWGLAERTGGKCSECSQSSRSSS